MRTTVPLDPDVAAAVAQLRQVRHVSISEAINTLARVGMTRPMAAQRRRTQQTADLGLLVDVTSVADALDQLDWFVRPW